MYETWDQKGRFSTQELRVLIISEKCIEENVEEHVHLKKFEKVLIKILEA